MAKQISSAFKQNAHWLIAFALSVGLAVYWNLIAVDRFVSRADVVLQTPGNVTPTISFQSLISGSSAPSDMLLLRDHILSVDMLKYADTQLGLRTHYSDSNIDWVSRLHAGVTIEEFHDYYLKRVNVELDEHAGILRLRITGFAPDFAQKLNSLLLAQGERFMNDLGRRLATEQMQFFELQVNEAQSELSNVRSAITEFQNSNGLVSPINALASRQSVISSLEAELASLKANQKALSAFQNDQSPELRLLREKINAIQAQILEEQSRLTGEDGTRLNTLAAEYQILEHQFAFAQKSYEVALAAYENARIEATRKLKQLSVIQQPTLPEYSEEPRRLYNTAAALIVLIFLAAIANMILIIIREHND